MGLTVIGRELKFRQFIKLRAKEMTKRMILRTVEISEKTYYEWCKIDDQDLPFITVPRSGGRDRITEPEDDQLLSETAIANNWSNLNELRQLPAIQGNANIAAASGRTLRRRLSDQGVRHRVAAIKERLREFHKERRLIYAEQFVNWTLVDWSRVIFIDEFGISTGEGGRVWIWRTCGTRYDERNLALIQRTRRFSVSFIAILSPDLNACENVGAMIKNLVRTERQPIESEDQLWEAVSRAHQTMVGPQWRQYFIDLLNSMPRRMEEVITAQGGHTHY
ncbi:unnamed protein product [Oppiella nova]|uniref:Transposase n=1 Tax=Oppiella nova TaxID=334625 RepID=A0A7R9QHY6_9ACAR|nr:unnamed protein product [Oppiella nova]CAG2166115.1 unnamed protein product [Oppiella nova]